MSEASSTISSLEVSSHSANYGSTSSSSTLSPPGLGLQKSYSDYSESYSYSGSPYSYSTSSPESPSSQKKKCDKPENECFRVVQMVADPACPPPTGIIGYVYTYTIRKRRRIVKKGLAPKQPYQVVVVKEKADPPPKVRKCEDPRQLIQEADDEICYANRQIARLLLDKERAKQKKQDAEVLRFRDEERRYERDSKRRRSRGSHRDCTSTNNNKSRSSCNDYSTRSRSSYDTRKTSRLSREDSECESRKSRRKKIREVDSGRCDDQPQQRRRCCVPCPVKLMLCPCPTNNVKPEPSESEC